ncbi:MAG: radical SAM protein [Anaerolineae bacterium]|nr:radical SAM protein [Anaerolineae bacterium]MDW8098012.1 radical SAM protein [Anaerolineae bacterium]
MTMQFYRQELSQRSSNGMEPSGLRVYRSRTRRAFLNIGTRILIWAGPMLARAGPVRHVAIRLAESRLRAGHRQALKRSHRPPGVERDRLDMGIAILHTVERALARGQLSEATLRGMLGTLIKDVLIGQGDWSAKARFRAKYGCNPPDFLLISPGKACNLRCVGCYADAGPTREKLDWAILDRLVTEAYELWGARFFVLSGGEPLAYRSNGKGVLDLAERHRDCFFLMYTNGTLIDNAVARRMAYLGNLTPAISLEGMRERTDERRGAGVFDQIVAAMGRLRREKVFFGVSLTATRHNADEILSDEFVDFFFERQGALYAWIFHYMPIGRSFTLDLMPTPEQRLRLWQRTWQLIRTRRLFIADFWNSGTLSDGCISAGRDGGYLCVDWNGAVSPCVFVPYSPVNIHDVYAQGKTLNEVWANPFFADIRAWQRAYGFEQPREGNHGNWLMPCPIRDHHKEFRQLLARHEPEPTDENAHQALLDASYAQGMQAYDEALEALLEPLWKRHYMDRTQDRL